MGIKKPNKNKLIGFYNKYGSYLLSRLNASTTAMGDLSASGGSEWEEVNIPVKPDKILPAQPIILLIFNAKHSALIMDIKKPNQNKLIGFYNKYGSYLLSRLNASTIGHGGLIRLRRIGMGRGEHPG